MVVAAGVPDRLYQQNHCGTYRSDDAGRTWICLDEGLPSTFGFPIVAHPSDPDTVFTIPLNGDDRGRYVPDARLAVWRTTDRGAHWAALRNGLPEGDAYVGILREAMAAMTSSRSAWMTADGSTVGELIDALDRRWPGVHDCLCARGPTLREFINVYVDGQPADPSSAVAPGSTVHVLPAVAAG